MYLVGVCLHLSDGEEECEDYFWEVCVVVLNGLNDFDIYLDHSETAVA